MPAPRPQEIFDELRRTVLGQEEALREIAVSLVKHLVGHPAGNILLVGNSGSGKTTLMKAIEALLGSHEDLASWSNVIRINASVLAEDRQGYGRAVLSRLYGNALKKLGPDRMQDALRMVERGIVFIDEIDKIRAQVGAVPSVRGIVAQEALLTLMENENVEFEVDLPLPATVSINSSGILFVAAGAFEDLYDTVLRRAIIGSDGHPLRPVVVVSQGGQVREELPFHLRDHLKYEDLFHYGMLPQFVSRFESLVVMNDLGQSDLARIFIEPERSIFRVSREYFAGFGIDLQITRAAVLSIAWAAAKQKRLGARALKDVYRRVIRPLEFDPGPQKGAEESTVVTVDEAMIQRSLPEAEEQGKR